MARRKRHPNPDQPLVGPAEAAILLGWDPRRVAVAHSRGRMPRPIAQLASGPVWRREDILALKANTKGRAGQGAHSPHHEHDQTATTAQTIPAAQQPDGADVTDLIAAQAELAKERNDRLRAEHSLQQLRADYNRLLAELKATQEELRQQKRQVRQLSRALTRLEDSLEAPNLAAPEGPNNPATSQAIRTLLESENVRLLQLAHEMALYADRWDPPPPGRGRPFRSRNVLPAEIDRFCLETLERRMKALARAIAIHTQLRGTLTPTERANLTRAKNILRQACSALIELDPSAARRYRINARGEPEELTTDPLRRDTQGKPVSEWLPLIRA